MKIEDGIILDPITGKPRDSLDHIEEMLSLSEKYPWLVGTTTTRRYLCTPAAAAGLTYTMNATAWNAASTWTQIVASGGIGDPYYITGFTCQYHNTPTITVDTTLQVEMQIATGAAASEVMKIQYPFSVRVDSAVGHHPVLSFDLPEPFTVTGNPRLAFRMLSSMAVATVWQGIKFKYQIT
jgi:hypothetical protein